LILFRNYYLLILESGTSKNNLLTESLEFKMVCSSLAGMPLEVLEE